MTDIVDSKTRSRMMSGIRGKDTKPELLIRKGLHRRGFRYRLHARGLPGKPDIILPKYKAVIFVHGCFWHGHDCHLFKWPSTRPEFWKKKIEGNRERDQSALRSLSALGWRTLSVWECAVKGKQRIPEDELVSIIARWLKGDDPDLSIRGN